ncbi:polyhydroxyalkanoate synthesis regulator DNA-binding domain-containing protein [Thermodesulfobacteriota bacterium]
MHKIKKYANRKLYDTTAKKYVSLDQLAELIKSGEEVEIVDNQSGEDITSSVLSQLLARDKKDDRDEVPSSVLVQMLRKGRGTLTDYAKKYATLFQSAAMMAEDEIDKFVGLLIRDKEISESEGSRLKKDILGYADNFKSWIVERVDRRVNEVLGMMNLATKEHVNELTAQIETLTEKVAQLEEKFTAEEEIQR